MTSSSASLFGSLTVKRALLPLLTHPRSAQLIKWFVYICLLLNSGQYIIDDYNAWQATRGEGAALSPLDVLSNFATTVDTVAWVALIVLLEFETYIISDEAYTPAVKWFMMVMRVVCYSLIGAAAWGYLDDTLDYYNVAPLEDVASLCQLAGQELFLQLNVIDYVEITAANCASLPFDGSLFRIDIDASVVDATTLEASRGTAWMDVSNAFVWILVVILIEVEVQLQNNDRFGSRLLIWTRFVKTLGYLLLIGNGIVWGLQGYYMYAWDAFLWIFGFWAIELNLAEWEIERVEELKEEAGSQ
ncbi:MAG: hypothetical protein AAGF57_15040 [Pseudomonadota bacterium]